MSDEAAKQGEEQVKGPAAEAEVKVEQAAGGTVVAEAGASNEGEAKAGEQAKTGEGTPAEGDKPKQTPWFQRRIDDLTRERWNERRRAEAAESELARVRGAVGGEVKPEGEAQQPTGKTYTEAEVRAITQTEARRLATQEAQNISFNNECNRVYGEGKEQFADFDDRLRAFQPLGGLNPNIIAAALETGKAAEVLHTLGGNLDEAARIFSLPPIKQVAELVKLAHSLGGVKAVSKAPAPITPKIGGSGKGTPNLEDPSLSTEEWMKLRNKALAAKRSA